MGADMCGYILCGPRKIKRTAVKKAIKELTGALTAAGNILGKDDQGSLSLFSGSSEALEDLKKRIPGLGPDDTVEDLGNLLDWVDLDNPGTEAKRIITEFVQMWEEEPHRDMMSRSFPGDERKKKIVVCGERTWGDGPEPDSAWGIADTAARLGLFELLGIE